MRHSLAHCWIITAMVFAIVLAPSRVVKAAPPQGADDPAANDPVEQAIRKGVAFLYAQQKNGNWEEAQKRDGDGAADTKGIQWGGLTAMTTYALLASGESPQEARLKQSIKFLSSIDILGTYAMGMKMQVWNSMPLSKEQKDLLKKDATLLMNAVKLDQPNRMGMFHYFLDPSKADYDHSTSNYGVLGMWAAAQQNLEVPTRFWEVVDKGWRDHQHKDGAWSYVQGPVDGHSASNAMTAAGVATLFITQEYLNQGKPTDCKGNIEDENINRGLAWLGAHYKAIFNEEWKHYGMYNIERVGTASGYKYFGTVDWFKDGSGHLVQTQKPDGSWDGAHGPVVSTVYSLLFLVKGRAPIMMNKLEYTVDLRGDKGKQVWDQRPRDIANLARHTGKGLEKDLNWQIVNLKVDSDDLHDAPVLYISGNVALNFSKDEKAKLKSYVENGGLILGHADCNSQVFSTTFMKLGQELFAGEFRDLPADHLIYNAHYKKATWGGFNPVLRGLSNGARELMVLIPAGDPARYWQIQNFSSAATKPLAELAANIYLYAIDKTTLKSKFKGQTYIVKRDDKPKNAATAIKVARLEYGGNWNPEPAGWRRIENILHNTKGVELQVDPVKLGDGKLKDYKIAHLTGTVKFRLTPGQKKELQDFVNQGGTLLIDAAGGVIDFKDSAESELQAMFGPAATKGLGTPLNPAHPVYSALGEDLSKATYREFAKKMLVSGMSVPRLRAIEVNNRAAVIYSPEDLSVGIVGMNIDGIYGYDPAYATKLVESIVLFAAGPSKVVAANPANAQPAGAKEPPAMEAKPKKKTENPKADPKNDAPKPDMKKPQAEPKKEMAKPAGKSAGAGGAGGVVPVMSK